MYRCAIRNNKFCGSVLEVLLFKWIELSCYAIIASALITALRKDASGITGANIPVVHTMLAVY